MKREYFLFVLLLLFGCKNNQDNTSTSTLILLQVNNDMEEEIYFESLVDSVKYIPVQNNKVIGEIDNLVVKNDSVYLISDSRYTKSIHLINKEGHILNSFNYLGKGPDEGLHLMDIRYDTYNNKFIALLRSPGKLLFFDEYLNHEKTIPLTYDAFRFHVDSSSFFLYCHEDMKICQLDIIGTNTKERKVIKLDSTTYNPYYPAPVFYNSFHNNTFFNAPYDSYIYKLKANDITPVFKLDTTKNIIKSGMLKIYPPSIQKIFEIGNTTIIEYSYRFSGRLIIYSKLEKKIISQGAIMTKTGLMGNLLFADDKKIFGCQDADRFVSFLENYQATEKNNNQIPKIILPENYEKISPEDNPLIVLYYLKDLNQP